MISWYANSNTVYYSIGNNLVMFLLNKNTDIKQLTVKFCSAQSFLRWHTKQICTDCTLQSSATARAELLGQLRS